MYPVFCSLFQENCILNSVKKVNFINLRLCFQNGRFDDAVEDIELRLEEFEHLLEMQQRDAATCLFKQMPQLSHKFEEMERVFDGIDRLELMVARYEMSVSYTAGCSISSQT